MKLSPMRAALFAGAALNAAPFIALAPAGAASAAAAETDKIGNTDDIIVTATKVNKETPITSSVHTYQPQSIINRSIIENSVPPTSDFSDVILLSPGASGTSNGNGSGLSESKTVLRGFQDGQYNITYDGIPFGDSNNPTHHSTAYFPDGTYERIIIDRGPGAATDLGQASYGGNIHIVSREVADKPFVEAQLVGGSYETFLGRLTVNTGSIQRLGGLKIIAIGEYKKTKGALSASDAWFANGFIKAELPITDKAKFSILSSYNQNFYHQADNNGVTCTGSIVKAAQADGNNCVAGSQVATYGKNFGLVDPNDTKYNNTAWPGARKDWNWTRKTTDFEVARLQWNVNNWLTIDNKAYTNFYKNFTLSTQTSTQPCTAVGTSTKVQTATTCSGYKSKVTSKTGGQTILGTTATTGGAAVYGTSTYVSSGTAATGPVLQNNPNDISGYTKLNQYRNSGNILQANIKTSAGLGKIGFWYEHSTSHRYGYTIDMTLAAANGAIGDGYYDFTNAAKYYDYGQFAYDSKLKEQDGTVVPQYLRYDEYTSWDQYQGFGEFAFKFLNDELTVTPGVKVQNFTRKIDTPLAAQNSRVGVTASASYKPTLPYASVNYLIQPNLSIYGQWAKGFLIPQLSDSLEVVQTSADGTVTCTTAATTAGNCNLQPTKTTNYQAGLVYAGERLNLDFDGYFIEASNSTSVDPSSGISTQSAGSATYQGVEAQASYVVMKGLTGIVNGSLNSVKDDTSRQWLAQAPNYTALVGIIYNTPAIKLSYLHKFTGRQFADAPVANPLLPGQSEDSRTYTGQTVRIQPYSMGTLAGSYTFRNFTLGASVYNLLDDRSTTKIGKSTSTSPLYFFQPGRSYQIELKARF